MTEGYITVDGYNRYMKLTLGYEEYKCRIPLSEKLWGRAECSLVAGKNPYAGWREIRPLKVTGFLPDSEVAVKSCCIAGLMWAGP